MSIKNMIKKKKSWQDMQLPISSDLTLDYISNDIYPVTGLLT